MQVSVYIATSLDGFIARKDGDIDWLMAVPPATDGSDYGFHAFYDSVDALVMGRNSFEKVTSFDEWPYPNKRVIVMSQSLIEIPTNYEDRIELSQESPIELYHRVEQEGLNRLYIDGGHLISSFLADGLVTDLNLTRIPILLGNGIPLFQSFEHDIALSLISSQSYDNGLVQSIYQVTK